jgi:hypothetical protein
METSRYALYEDHNYPERKRVYIAKELLSSLGDMPLDRKVAVLERAAALAKAETRYWIATINQAHIATAKTEVLS